MKAITSEQMRVLDRKAIDDYGVTGEELMERAGEGIAEYIKHLTERSGVRTPYVLFFAGRGNNGGDAFVAARLLHEDGFEANVWLTGTAGEIRGEALCHLSKMRAAGVALRELPTKEAWDEAWADADPADVLVDGILGIGLKGPARGPAAGAIHCLNMMAQEGLVVAIDVPSGLDADTGESTGDTVVADVTMTMGLPKIGLLKPSALNYVGTVEVIDIGIPWELVRQLSSDPELITGWEVRQLFKRRPRNAHKGMFGHLLVIAGAMGYPGAAMMTLESASKSGVGLITAIVPQNIFSAVAAAVPEVMVRAAPETETGALAEGALDALPRGLEGFDAIVIGPGLTDSPSGLALLQGLVKRAKVPILLDADAINVLHGDTVLLAGSTAPIIVTPHPGEMARLLGMTVDAIQADRMACVKKAVEMTHATVVLKGAGTLVATKDRPVGINLSGNPGMAKGGSGDVLAGLIGGFLAQGVAPFEAACAGVFVHGRAGDCAALRKSQVGMTALDIVDEIAYVLREILLR